MSSRNRSQLASPAAAPGVTAAPARLEMLLVMGNDAVLAARPASPVQLAHAAMRAGFDAVIPASWGDELVAADCARRLGSESPASALFCACPEVASRVLGVGPDLAPFLASFVPPPVALSRYLRALHAPQEVRLTYVGRCPGAESDAYDARIAPEELLRLLDERGIVPTAEPEAFEDVVPPDRRRFHSLPGGLPAVSALRATTSHHSVVELAEEDFAAELAQHLLDGHPKLVDAAVRLGCACAGARSGCARDPRVELMAIEPPRAPSPVVVLPREVAIDFSLPLPRASRSASDLVAAMRRRSHADDAGLARSEPDRQVAADRPVERTVDVAADAPHPPRRKSPTFGTPVVRTAAGVGPITRGTDGRVLRRAYVARRRASGRPLLDDVPTQPPVEARVE